MNTEILDIGCGSNKFPGSFGVDIHPYQGVDKVINLDVFPWELPSDSYGQIHASHIIEHVEDLVKFMRELHRIAKPGGQIIITTPHFSSFNSWADPTHRRHMSTNWYELFDTGYLAAQTGKFECFSSEVTFGKSFRNVMGKLIVKIRGLRAWEKSYAFSFPGMDVKTILNVVK